MIIARDVQRSRRYCDSAPGRAAARSLAIGMESTEQAKATWKSPRKEAMMTFPTPTDIQSRPIAVIGSGTLGRRIALMMSTQGGEVRLYDQAQHSLEEGVRFVEETLPMILPSIPNSRAAQVTGIGELAAAVDGAWLVFESVPERLDLKIEIFGMLDSVSSSDAILASNSSSFPA